MNRGRRRRRGRDPNRPLNSHAEGWRGLEKKNRRRDKREGERKRGGQCTHAHYHTVYVAPPKAFLEVAPLRAGVDLMNGNVGIIVFTRGTHGCLSRHTWRGNIPFIKRSARSSHRRTHPAVRPTRMHMHARRHADVEGYTTLCLPRAGG